MNKFKTMSFRIDEETNKKIEELQKHLKLNVSEIIRFGVDFTNKSISQEILSHEEIIKITKYHVITAFLSGYMKEDSGNLELLNNILNAIDGLTEESVENNKKDGIL